tara:strand:- start:88 stop:792 length:705 start_codon:yes stop_codon:yes gene_type:complete
LKQTFQNDYNLDLSRVNRTGLEEAIYCRDKSTVQISDIIQFYLQRKTSAFFTRLNPNIFASLDSTLSGELNYDSQSETASVGSLPEVKGDSKVAIVSAGTSDLGVAREASRTLDYYGVAHILINDVGVAGLWRLLDRIEVIKSHEVIIAIAGMDAALPTVLGGLVPCPIIGVPTSVGYGVAKGGRSALNSMLSSCSSGLMVMNIDNGYGAACGAIRILRRIQQRPLLSESGKDL